MPLEQQARIVMQRLDGPVAVMSISRSRQPRPKADSEMGTELLIKASSFSCYILALTRNGNDALLAFLVSRVEYNVP